MIILKNEFILGTRIIYEDGKFELKKNNEVVGRLNGVGILTDSEELIGVFLLEDRVHFIYNNTIIDVEMSSFKMENMYISSTERRFRVYSGGEVICEIIYVPYIDPGMIIYESEEDEFDPLLLFTKMFLTMNDTIRTVEYIKCLQENSI